MVSEDAVGVEAAQALGLTPALLGSLDRLSLPSRRLIPGAGAGQRRSPRSGGSVEFADFRSYVPGDDFRRIDWSAYARLDRLLLRLHEAEEDICASMWVDVSASMEWGSPPKSRCARSIAGALCYLALSRYDRASAIAFASDIVARAPAVRGRTLCTPLWRMLATARAGGTTDFGAVARAARAVPRGVAFIISDFLSESDPARALSALRSTGHDVALVQVLAPDELSPELRGDLRLVDIETRSSLEITATPGVIAAYREALHEHTQRMASLARAHSARHVQVSSASDLRFILLQQLPQAGLLR